MTSTGVHEDVGPAAFPPAPEFPLGIMDGMKGWGLHHVLPGQDVILGCQLDQMGGP